MKVKRRTQSLTILPHCHETMPLFLIIPFLLVLLSISLEAAPIALANVEGKNLQADIEAKKQPRIFCKETTFDFGSKDSSEIVDHTFVLKNTGNSDLVITAVRPACGCTAAELTQSTIPPGESAKLSAKLTLAGRSGEVQKPILIESNDPANPALQLVMQGTVVNEFTVTPSVLTLRQTASDPNATGSVMISSNGNAFQITKAEAFPSSIRVRADPMPDGLSYQISAIFKKIPESDPAPCLITLQTDNPRQPTLEIATTIVLQKKIIVAPERIILRHGDAISKKYIILKSADGAALAIKDILTPDTSVKVDYTSTASSIRLAIRGLDAQRDLDGKKITVDFTNGESVQIPLVFESRK
jgi:hypothetical protein